MIDQLTHIDFALIGLVTVLCTIMVVAKNIIHILTSFLTVLFVVGVVFLLFGSGFLFITQLLVYVGAVTVMIIFAIMLTKRSTNDKNLISLNHNIVSGLLVVLVVGGGAFLVLGKRSMIKPKQIEIDEVRGLGIELMSKYLLAFEVLALFLLIALILAAVIAGKKQESTK